MGGRAESAIERQMSGEWKKIHGLAKSVVGALALFVLDAFFLDQGLIASAILFIGLPVMLIRALIARKNRPPLKRRLAVAGIYLAAFLLAIGVIRANVSIAKHRAQAVIAACEKYRAKHGAYPENLAGLVPEFLDRIPAAKYNFSSSREFIYTARKGEHILMYALMPPFDRRYYEFEQETWGKMD
jgi:hypothetical protein